MRLSKSEVERRTSVALTFFKANPKATAKAFNDQLASGGLTGREERRMGLKTVYALRAEASVPKADGSATDSATAEPATAENLST